MRKIGLLLFTLSQIFLVSKSPGMVNKGDWLGGGGFGLTLSPTLLMISPELEYVYSPNLNFGSLVQMGFGSGVIVTVSGTCRGIWGDPSEKLRPTFEGGLGLAMASGVSNDSVGVHILVGGGFDYVYDKNLTLGSMIRFNFAPPLKSMFLSWPMIVARYRL